MHYLNSAIPKRTYLKVTTTNNILVINRTYCCFLQSTFLCCGEQVCYISAKSANGRRRLITFTRLRKVTRSLAFICFASQVNWSDSLRRETPAYYAWDPGSIPHGDHQLFVFYLPHGEERHLPRTRSKFDSTRFEFFILCFNRETKIKTYGNQRFPARWIKIETMSPSETNIEVTQWATCLSHPYLKTVTWVYPKHHLRVAKILC